MMFTLASLAAMAASASAMADFSKWAPPGPGDVRSPCPGLNSLANHGIINRNGKNLTIPDLIVGLQEGLSVGPDFTTAIGMAGLLSSPNPAGGSFDLNDLDQHNFPIEHDASLSRRDAFFGNDYSFYYPNFQMVLSHFNGSYTSIPTASKAKYSRVQNSRAINPTFTYGPREFILSYGETSLYLQTMSDPYSGVARVDFVKYLFELEKLPYEIGWRPSNQTITLTTLGQMIMELYAANSGDQAPEGLLVTTDSYKDALEGINPVTGLLGNATDA